MKPDRLPDYLDHMLEAATLACTYVQGMDRAAFAGDKKTQQAVILNLILIGEEATKVLKDHEAFALANAHVPWRAMKGMRNRIAHGYFDIDLEVVWDTVLTALPDLLKSLPSIDEGEDGATP